VDEPTTEADALVYGCLEDPGQELPLLVYADWLEENGAVLHAALVRHIATQEWITLTSSHAVFGDPVLINVYGYSGRRFLWVTFSRRAGKADTPDLAQRYALANLLHHVALGCVCEEWGKP
jgi:uncharacterized protein (TIGR02996 family)